MRPNVLRSSAIALALLGLTAGCHPPATTTEEATPDAAPSETTVAATSVEVAGEAPAVGTRTPLGVRAGGAKLQEPEPSPGIHFRLSDAEPSPDEPGGPAPREPAVGVTAVDLTADEVAALLDRLPAFTVTVPAQTSFAPVAGPKPPPVTGRTVQQPFPPAADVHPPVVPTAVPEPLAVRRRHPMGDVELATDVSVTFSQPMVPVAAVDEVARRALPVVLDPQPPGEWRWIDTTTLLFEAEQRFPMATAFTVEVLAGTRSTIGGALPASVKWAFRTPPVSVVGVHPSSEDGPTDRQPVILIELDQAIEPGAILEHVALRAANEDIPLQLASEAEIQADETVAARIKPLAAERWVALRPTRALPPETRGVIQIGPGLPSREGPLLNQGTAWYVFEVHGPLQASRASCGGSSDTNSLSERTICDQWQRWQIEFNNPLDEAALDPATIVITPTLPDALVRVVGSAVTIAGNARPSATHTVRIPAELRDIFGQTLGEPVTTRFAARAVPPPPVFPSLSAASDRLIVLDPAAPPRLEVVSVANKTLEVRLFAVQPYKWPAFAETVSRQEIYDAGHEYPGTAPPVPPPPLPGELVWSGTIESPGDGDVASRIPIDLSPALRDGVGQVLAIIEPGRWSRNDLNKRNRPLYRWIQVTRLGLDAFEDGESALVWVTSLEDGRPIEGARVALEPGGEAVTTAADGLARPDPGSRGAVVTARLGEDVAFAPRRSGAQPPATLRWYVFDDRGIYRPGEEVHVKGWGRRYVGGKGGDVEPLPESIDAIEYALQDPRADETVLSGTLAVDTYGGFDAVLSLPEDIDLGEVPLELTPRIDGLPDRTETYRLYLTVAEFRRPEFEVHAADEQPVHFLDAPAVASIGAAYYTGEALSDAEVRWEVTARSGRYTPPGWSDFGFGSDAPSWWSAYDAFTFGTRSSSGDAGGTRSHDGRTDADGVHRLAITVDRVQPLTPVALHAQGTVQDLNRQSWTDEVDLLVHPARYYVGLRPDAWFTASGNALGVDVIVTDLDGTPVGGPTATSVTLRAEHEVWTWDEDTYEWTGERTPSGECDLASASEPVRCTLRLQAAGTHRITAEVRDPEGRLNRTVVTLFVLGDGWETRRVVDRAAATHLAEDTVLLVPDAETYQPGDVAEILVQAPFVPAEGLLSVRRSGLERSERFRMTEATTILRVPIEEAHVPNLVVQVDLVGETRREGDPRGEYPPRPAYATGSLDLAIPPLPRTLAVSAAPRAPELRPGGRTMIDLAIRDASGGALADASVTMLVVDEAVLALTDYRVPDPIATFYPRRDAGVTDARQRDLVMLAPLDVLITPTPTATATPTPTPTRTPRPVGTTTAVPRPLFTATAGLPPDIALTATVLAVPLRATPVPGRPATGGGDGGAVEIPTERTDLDPVAAFVPDVRTDAEGQAAVEVVLPDNLTRYRITVVSTDGATRFGMGESSLVARLPLMVRPSPPRFLNYGDVFELPVVVQNQTDAAAEVNVVVRAVNLTLDGGERDASTGVTSAGRRLTIAGGARAEVRFPAAAEMPGRAEVQVAALSTAGSDAHRAGFPVRSPTTSEAFATYGQIDTGVVAQPIERPAGAIEGFGGLELTTSATALSELTDAYLYLRTYPFDCAEQIASRLVATVALRDVLTAFGVTDIPDAEAIDAAVRADLELLRSRQTSNGGFVWWSASHEGADPFVTAHVAHALARAEAKGYAVDDDMLRRVVTYLGDIDRYLDDYDLPRGEARWAIEAYALYTRSLLDGADAVSAQIRQEARPLAAAGDELPTEAVGWLLAVLTGDPAAADSVADLRRVIENRTREVADSAQIGTSFETWTGNIVLASNRRADAVVLEALIADQPDSDLIPKLVRGLLGGRVKGRWSSTQENAFVLLALDRYFRTYEAVTPDFVARAWLDQAYAAEHTYRGRTTDRNLTEIPLDALPRGTDHQVVLAKEGAGRLYYRLGLTYAPAALAVEALDRGFRVQRSYAAVDEPGDVRRRADGSWEVRAGARVRVRLSMRLSGRRFHVALVDSLPAGLESIDPRLAVVGGLPPLGQDDMADLGLAPYDWWGLYWPDHTALRDDRVELFARELGAGDYGYGYVTRATTPGEFIAPPARAEEMYRPETFGRSATDRVVVRE